MEKTEMSVLTDLMLYYSRVYVGTVLIAVDKDVYDGDDSDNS